MNDDERTLAAAAVSKRDKRERHVADGKRSRFQFGWMTPGWWAYHTSGSAPGNGGFPPLPWPRNSSNRLADVSVVYFAGSSGGGGHAGPNSELEARAEARHGIVGISWHVGLASPRHQELNELAAIRQLKRINPSVRVLVPRETQVVTDLWEHTREAMAEHPEYWLTNSSSGRPLEGEWQLTLGAPSRAK